VLQVLPSFYPIIGGASGRVFADVGQRVVEVVGVDVVENLPEDLAVLELVPCCDSAGEVEGVDLRCKLAIMNLLLQAPERTYPVEKSSE
jgi:hypothetical protein